MLHVQKSRTRMYTFMYTNCDLYHLKLNQHHTYARMRLNWISIENLVLIL